MPTQSKGNIVFAHGLWADGSCYGKVIPALQAEGYEVVSVQNSLDTLEGDVAAVTRALGRVSTPAILVGHSYGGTVITGAGADDRGLGRARLDARERHQILRGGSLRSPVDVSARMPLAPATGPACFRSSRAPYSERRKRSLTGDHFMRPALSSRGG